MFSRRNPEFEYNSGIKHPEHETRNTCVSEYLRKYGQGKIDSLPTDSRPEVHDNRSVDEMLSDSDAVTDSLSSEQLDVILEIQSKADDFEKAFADIELTKKQRSDFDKAIAVLKNSNSSYEQKADAYRIIEELEGSQKVKRARVSRV